MTTPTDHLSGLGFREEEPGERRPYKTRRPAMTGLAWDVARFLPGVDGVERGAELFRACGAAGRPDLGEALATKWGNASELFAALSMAGGAKAHAKTPAKARPARRQREMALAGLGEMTEEPETEEEARKWEERIARAPPEMRARLQQIRVNMRRDAAATRAELARRRAARLESMNRVLPLLQSVQSEARAEDLLCIRPQDRRHWIVMHHKWGGAYNERAEALAEILAHYGMARPPRPNVARIVGINHKFCDGDDSIPFSGCYVGQESMIVVCVAPGGDYAASRGMNVSFAWAPTFDDPSALHTLLHEGIHASSGLFDPRRDILGTNEMLSYVTYGSRNGADFDARSTLTESIALMIEEATTEDIAEHLTSQIQGKVLSPSYKEYRGRLHLALNESCQSAGGGELKDREDDLLSKEEGDMTPIYMAFRRNQNPANYVQTAPDVPRAFAQHTFDYLLRARPASVAALDRDEFVRVFASEFLAWLDPDGISFYSELAPKPADLSGLADF